MYTYPDSSPWGKIQTCHELSPGAFEVTTASHGGIMVHSKTAKEILSDAARACAFREGAYICFEEDCDAPVALRELLDKGLYSAPANYEPGEFSDLINRSLREYHPDYWRAREAAHTVQKPDTFWYYITNEALQRGTYPHMEGMRVRESVKPVYFEGGKVKAFGTIEYPRPLTPEQEREYALVPSSGNRDRPSIRSKLKADAARKDLPAAPVTGKKKDSLER